MTDAPAGFVPGWACDGRDCMAVVSDLSGLTTKQSLERSGWLVEHTFGVVVRAWCPHCRRGKLARGNRVHIQQT